MAPNARLASHKQVIVGARISKSGDALAKPGDLEGYSEAVAVGSDKVRIVIGTTVK
jgi:cytochrome c-type biogenesis protein CcmH